MTKIAATTLFNQVLALREESGAEAAYAWAREHGEPGDPRHMNLLYALAAASGQAGTAFALLSEAVKERGFWYPADYLREDEDLASLRSEAGFAELVELCEAREEAALEQAAPGLKVLKPEPAASGGSEAGLTANRVLLVLHGDQENERDTEVFWQSAVKQGWTVGLVRSSQIKFADAHGWDDIDLGAAELREHMESMLQDSASSDRRVVLGAFSTGAEVALNALLHDELQVDGLLMVSPWLDDAAEWVEALERLEDRTPRSVWIAGADDEEGREASRTLTGGLQDRGLKARLKVVNGIGHDYPEDFAVRLAEGLTWITETK
ncbi:alpha/beta hydrolase [Saccharibacillus sp. JS10]|uniref:alpha/beta hydrolase n=1 Tax=Saccharibacillus sp. JS10 TaxID=2950552 RepID=UPI00210DECBA|nr:hypothetical protein [Saccharibacillus sp. JS10]MCQ4088670.1 hypothetical protein [Saccharibacillus sp. JS10]